MRFALIDGERREPQPSLSGQCPGCGQAVTAKCGRQRVWHWAHKGRLTCDTWWERETEWHRRWKSLFPASWQEVVLKSTVTGERHIADVQTSEGLVMEFQHSAITTQERKLRESFYGNMIWVVDGTRLKRDRPRIDENLPQWRWLEEGTVRTAHWPEDLFPKFWINCAVPVLFDFDGLNIEAGTGRQNHLICLLPNRFRSMALYFPVGRSALAKVGEGELTIFDWRAVHSALLESERRASQVRNRRRSRF